MGLFEREERGAVFSACGRYRYVLWRHWGGAPLSVAFLLLNPSTADAEKDDPTIRRCIRFAKRWGYGGLRIVNLFAWRSTDPRVLPGLKHPHSEPGAPQRNDEAIFKALAETSFTVCAWGVWGSEHGADVRMLALLRETWKPKLRCLGKNSDGSPKHPLYLPLATVPIPF